MRERLFEMMFEYLNENYPNVLGEMIQCAKEESSE
jgi:hypothetical protein